MNSYGVHIFCTSEVTEFPEAYTNEIADLLNQVKDNFAFFGRGYVDDALVKEFIPNIKDPYSGVPMNDFFELCKKIKTVYELTYEYTFIVLLTNKNHNKNWFSSTDGINIYINVNDLERFSSNQSKYPIAFQIIENIFQARCGIVYTDDKLDEKLHKISEGCVNDICNNKLQIINKLKESKICRACKKMAIETGVRENELEWISEILKIIKARNHIRLEKTDRNKKIFKIDESGNITVNEKKLNIPTLPKAFYLFFIQQYQGTPPYKLKSYNKEIASIYQKLKHKGEFKYKLSKANIEKIKNYTTSTEQTLNPNFYKIVSTINKTIDKEIDLNLVNLLYLQPNDSKLYFVSIDHSMTEIHPNFILDM
jgi:hypothetical protein